MTNDLYKQLSIRPAVTARTAYAAKDPDNLFTGNDGLLKLARGLEEYNPNLKKMADLREQRLIEQGMANAYKIAEESGSLQEIEDRYAEQTRQNPNLAATDPYLRRFLDREIAKKLMVQRQEAAARAYLEGGWGDLEGEEYLNAKMTFEKEWYESNKTAIDKLDPREYSAHLGETSKGMHAVADEQHLKDMSKKVLRERAELKKATVGEYLDLGLKEFSNLSEDETVRYEIGSEEEMTYLKTKVGKTDVLKNLKTQDALYISSGMTEAEAYETTLTGIRNAAVTDPDNDTFYLAAAAAYMEDKNIVSPGEQKVWLTETDTLSYKEWKRRNEKTEAEYKREVFNTKRTIDNGINSIGDEALTIDNREFMKRFDIPEVYADIVSQRLNASRDSTKQTETEEQHRNYLKLDLDVRRGVLADYDEIMANIEVGYISTIRGESLFTRLDKIKEEGTSKVRAYFSALENDVSVVRNNTFRQLMAVDSNAATNYDMAFMGALHEEVGNRENELGRDTTQLERRKIAVKIDEDLRKRPDLSLILEGEGIKVETPEDFEKTQRTKAFEWDDGNPHTITLGKTIMGVSWDKERAMPVFLKSIRDIDRDIQTYKMNPDILAEKVKEHTTFSPTYQEVLDMIKSLELSNKKRKETLLKKHQGVFDQQDRLDLKKHLDTYGFKAGTEKDLK